MQGQKFLYLIIFLFSFNVSAQRSNGDNYNRLGIRGGLNYGAIKVDGFDTSPGTGFFAGLTTLGTVYNNFLLNYGVSFFQNNTGIRLVENSGSQPVEIDFETTGVQINLFAGHRIIREYLSIEGGPVLQINSKWTTDDGFGGYKVFGQDFLASDLEDISRINLNLAGNISAGFRDIKIWLQYQYGVTDILNGLDLDSPENTDSRPASFKGNQEMAAAGIVYYF